jgi:hypothetical protein
MEVICCTFRIRGPSFRIIEKQNHRWLIAPKKE